MELIFESPANLGIIEMPISILHLGDNNVLLINKVGEYNYVRKWDCPLGDIDWTNPLFGSPKVTYGLTNPTNWRRISSLSTGQGILFLGQESGKGERLDYGDNPVGDNPVGDSPLIVQDSDFAEFFNGSFGYIGTEINIEIPHIIQGIAITSYNSMFNTNNGHLVESVISTNSNVTDMAYMFQDNLATTLDLSSFDTSSVTDMHAMFAYSQAITLDLSGFDTSNVTYMMSMFAYSKATILDLSSFDVSSGPDMMSMFLESQATTGYARTQADADKFNASSNKPAGLTFVVKS